MVAYPIGAILVAAVWWGILIARAQQRQERHRQRAAARTVHRPTVPPRTASRPTIPAPPKRPAQTPLMRSEASRYEQVNRELRQLRTALARGGITEQQFQAEANALMDSLDRPAAPTTAANPHLEAEQVRFARIQQELEDLRQQRAAGRVTFIEFHKRSAALIREGSDVVPADATPTHPAVYSRNYRPTSPLG